MNKTAILLSVVLVSGFVSVKMVDFRPEGSLDALSEEQRVEEAMVSYQCFKLTFEATLAELESGSIRLKEAHARVCSVAQRYRPEYLVQLGSTEPGNTAEERVAYNLVAHISSLAEFSPHLRPRCLDLEKQLQDLLAELRSVKKP